MLRIACFAGFGAAHVDWKVAVNSGKRKRVDARVGQLVDDMVSDRSKVHLW